MLERFIIGVDPDSDKHGVATYKEGVLVNLQMLARPELIKWISSTYGGVIVSIEDVLKNNFIYARNQAGNKSVQAKIGLNIGRCQQAQAELMRDLDNLSIRYVLHKPQKGNWAKNKAQFEKATGWQGKSNEDTRAAAYFGYLELFKQRVGG